MNYVKGILALLLITKGGVGLYNYINHYSALSQYGKGYILGNGIMLLLGVVIAILLIKTIRKSTQKTS